MVTHHVHASQRYDRAPGLLQRVVRRYTQRPVDLLTVTEVGGHRRAAVLRRPGDGWGVVKGRSTDCALMFRRSTWTVRHWAVHPLTRLTYWRANGTLAHTPVLVVVLDRRPPGQPYRLLVTVAHLPSAVQAGSRLRSDLPYRVAAWRDAVVGWRLRVAGARRAWHADGVLTVGDWNVDLRLPEWRQYLRRAFPGQRLTWRTPLPRNGTRRARIIDASLTSLNGRARLMEQTAASDHRAYHERLTAPATPPAPPPPR